jgi:hypothetical protein
LKKKKRYACSIRLLEGILNTGQDTGTTVLPYAGVTAEFQQAYIGTGNIAEKNGTFAYSTMADNPLVATTNDTCTCEALQCKDVENAGISSSEPVRIKFLTSVFGKYCLMRLLKAS